MTNLGISPADVSGLLPDDQARLAELISVHAYHEAKNRKKAKYYEGHVTLGEVNLGIALPEGMRGLEIGCSWGAKCVDVLASRSRFDGFVGPEGQSLDTLTSIMDSNDFIAAYQKACKDELKYGCTFVTLSGDDRDGCKIRFHSPLTASALWDGEKNRIDCGFAVISTAPDESKKTYVPTAINIYTDTNTIRCVRSDYSGWKATYYPHAMGRPLMEPLIFDASSSKPFGQSRIKEPVRRLIEGYVRTIANATIGLEFATSPQKYLLGITDEQYDVVINQKFKQYVGSIIAATDNPETGEPPKFGQLTQGNIEPHVQMIRILATQFSASTGLTVTDTGVVNDANPTSSDAILAQSQTLVLLAEQLNAGNGSALQTIARMAIAIARGTSLDELSPDDLDVIAHFKNPAMPSVAVTADAAIKIASARPAFADTDTFLEMIGFDQADIRRIKSQEVKARGLSVLTELGGGMNETDNS